MNHFYRIISGVVLLTLSVPRTSSAQLGADTYGFSTQSGSFTPVSGGTNVSAIEVDDGTSAFLPLGFEFNYCGTDYDEIKASSNGWLSFVYTGSSSVITNSASYLADIQPALMPLWDDLSGSAGEAHYSTTGTAPNRVFTMEYKDWRWNYSSSYPPTISFQVKLYETTNVIEFIYRQEAGTGNFSGSGATIGIGDASTPVGYLVLPEATASPTPSTTTFTTDINTRPPTGQIYRFTPLPGIDMGVSNILIDTPFCSHSVQPVSAELINHGTNTIDSVEVFWSVDGVSQPSVMYLGPPIRNLIAAPLNTGVVELGLVHFENSNPVSIKAWTYQPDGLEDANNDNDTLEQSKAGTLPGFDTHISPRDTFLCLGAALTLDAGSAPEQPIYIWNQGTMSQTLSVTHGGQYHVRVINSRGCESRDTVFIEEFPDPTANSIAIIDEGGGMFTFNVIGANYVDTYTWDFGDGSEPETGPGPKTHTYTTPGTYTATLTLSNTCAETVITRIMEISPVGIAERNPLAGQIEVYPNPASSEVRIRLGEQLEGQWVRIVNLMGQLLFEAPIGGQTEVRLTLGQLSAGTYQVFIATRQGEVVKKLQLIR